MNEREIHFTTENTIRVPLPGPLCPVPISDWEQLRKNIECIESHRINLYTLGFTLFGMAITSIVGSLALPCEELFWAIPINVFCGLAGIMLFLCGTISLLAGFHQRDVLKVSKKYTLSFMDHLESKYLPSREDRSINTDTG